MDPMFERAANPWLDCAFAKALQSCRCSHINRQVCLISWHVFQIFQRRSDFVPEEANFGSMSKYIFHKLK